MIVRSLESLNTKVDGVSDDLDSLETYTEGALNINNLFHIQDQKANTTVGGAASATTQHIRDLNTEVTNNISGASLTANIITLPEGDYYIEATAPTYNVAAHKIRLYNTADSSVEIVGTNANSYWSDISTLSGYFTIAASKTFRIDHYTQNAKATDGLGRAVSSGDIEVYTDVRIWKVG